MSTSDLRQLDVMQAVLEEASAFLAKHDLKVVRVTPTVAGLHLKDFAADDLRSHKTVHLTITIETEPPHVGEEEENKSNLVASNVYEDDRPGQGKEGPKGRKDQVQKVASALDSILHDYLDRHIAQNLDTALAKSKATFPNYESQLNKMYEVLKQNIYQDLMKNQKDADELQSRISQVIETTLGQAPLNQPPSIRKSVWPAGHGLQKSGPPLNPSTIDVSRVNHAYFSKKINEIFEENKSKLFEEARLEASNAKGGDKAQAEVEKLALSRLLHHYDALKSRVIADMERMVGQSVIESQVGAAVGEDWREVVVQGFLKNLNGSKIVEAKEEDERSQSSSRMTPGPAPQDDLGQSVRLKEELKQYISQLLHQNLQNSALK